MIKKTKMVCTIGPKSEKREVMQSLLDAGMNVMRLNFSHGDFVEHGGRIDNLEEIMKESGKVFAVLLDTRKGHRTPAQAGLASRVPEPD